MKKKILNDLISVQKKPVEIGGYFMLDDKKTSAVIRPSAIFNKIIDKM